MTGWINRNTFYIFHHILHKFLHRFVLCCLIFANQTSRLLLILFQKNIAVAKLGRFSNASIRWSVILLFAVHTMNINLHYANLRVSRGVRGYINAPTVKTFTHDVKRDFNQSRSCLLTSMPSTVQSPAARRSGDASPRSQGVSCTSFLCSVALLTAGS